MNIVKHPLCTHSIGAPADMPEPTCSALPVATYKDEHGHWTVSYWLPTAAELLDLNKGSCVALHVRASGRQHPVVSMGTEPAQNASQGTPSEDASPRPAIDVSSLTRYFGDRDIGATVFKHAEGDLVMLEDVIRLLETISAEPKPYLSYPATLTSELMAVLGMPNFQCAPIAHGYRDAGLADIPHKAESEQAYVIDKLVRFVILHGTDWRKHAAEDLGKVREILLIKKGAEEHAPMTQARFNEKMDALDKVNPGPLVAALERAGKK